MPKTIHRLKQGICITPLLLLASIATAQAQNATADSAAKAQSDQPVVVIVTGSLIRKANNTAVSPIVTLNSESLKQTGTVTLETALNALPSVTPAGTAATGGQGTGGHVTVNLHGLGSNRNLVLLDGRRLPLADIAGDVDINFIPEAIVGGIESITGGASAVYGSDAMSGVVNFKTINYFDGLRLNLQTGNSAKNDLPQSSTSFAIGSKFGDGRGRLIFSGSYTNRAGLSGSKRADFFGLVTPSSYIGQSTFVPSANNLPSQAAYNSVFSGYGVTATVPHTLNLGFNDNGTLFAQTGAVNYSGPTTGLWAIIGGNVRMPVGLQAQLLNPLKRTTLYSKFDYKLSDHLTAYGQFLYVDSTVNTASGNSLTQLNNLTTIPVTNPFIPADLKTILNSRPNPNANFLWNSRYVGLPYKSWDEQYSVGQVVLGLKGDLPAGWSWDAYGSTDYTTHNQLMHNAVLKSQVQNLLNASDGGASICSGGFNPFGLANNKTISPACQAYMTTTAHSQEKITQSQFQATVQGPVFHLPAGDVTLALLAGHHENSYVYQPDSNLAAGNIEAVIASAAVSKHTISNNDLAAQIDVPILSDLPWVKELGVGAAYRVSDYSTSGKTNSYEADFHYKPFDALLLRGSYQRAVRAPNIGELFAPAQGVQVVIGTPPASIGDPCDVRSTARTGANGAQVATLCAAQGVPSSVLGTYTFPTTATGGLTTGNPNLTPEKADTFNYGFVLNPRLSSPWLHDLSLSVDYYNIKISNVISVVSGLTSLSKCFNLDGSNTSYSNSNIYCQNISRDANGQIVTIAQPYLNLGGLRTDGVEIQVSWQAKLAELGLQGAHGSVYLTSTLNNMLHYKVQSLPGSAFQEFSNTNTPGASYPTWKATTTYGYRTDTYTVGMRWRYQDKIRDISSVLTPSAAAHGVPAYSLYDLFGSYNLTEGVVIRAGINNLFDKKMPIVASSQNNADPSVFDPVGRAWYLSLNLSY